MLIGPMTVVVSPGTAAAEPPTAAPPPTLMSKARAVLYGTVNGHTTVPGTLGLPVDTVFQVGVTRPVKGVAAGSSVGIRVAGGDLGDGTAVAASDEATFRPGENVLVYLDEPQADRSWRVVGGDEGVIPQKYDTPSGPTDNPEYGTDPNSPTDSCANQPNQAGYSGFVQLTDQYGHHDVWPAGTTDTISFNSNAIANQSTLDTGINAWNAAGGTLRFADGGVTTASPDTHNDGTSTFGWGSVTVTGALGQEFGRFVVATGQLLETDIVFNSALQGQITTGTNYPSSTQYDAVALMLHEMGHAVGLGHQSSTSNVMYCGLAAGDSTHRSLGDGDKAGDTNFYPPNTVGYYLVGQAGAVYGLGGLGSLTQYNAGYYGGPNQNNVINYPTYHATDIEVARPKRDGYIVLGSNGGVYAYGSARFLGSPAGSVTGTAVDMAIHPTGNYYWILGSDGGVFAYGSPGGLFYGSAAGVINGAAVAIAPSNDGGGYWLVSDKGSVYAYGNAPYKGGDVPTYAQPAKGIVPTTTGQGYWILGADGAAYPFGDAPGRYLPNAGTPVKIGRDPLSNGVMSLAGGGYTELNGITNYGWGTGDTYAALGVTRKPVAPSLTLGTTSSSMTVPRGTTKTDGLTIQSNDTFYSGVSITVSGAPSGVTAYASPSSFTQPSSATTNSTLFVSASSTMVPTSFTLTVTACGQGLCSSQQVSVVVSLV
jgi:hypothetical protein